jgi:hypothetical protein
MTGISFKGKIRRYSPDGRTMEFRLVGEMLVLNAIMAARKGVLRRLWLGRLVIITQYHY